MNDDEPSAKYPHRNFLKFAALRTDGAVFACGLNSKGQLGINSTSKQRTFVQATGISGAAAIACGLGHAVALRSDGGTMSERDEGKPKAVSENAGGNRPASPSTSSGEAPDASAKKRTFLRFAGAGAIAAFVNHLIHPALAGTWQQIGTAATGATGTWRLISPIQIPTPLKASVACGYYHTVALRSDGLVFACGYNNKGPLGINSTSSRSTFVQAIGISMAVAVAAGEDHTVVLRSDGLVFACGLNFYGTLGTGLNAGGFTGVSTFVQATGISNAVAIASEVYHTVALRSDGLVFACGYNGKGQLGINSMVNQSTFAQATGISNAVAIAVGENHTAALRSDGLVFAVGNDGYGQLGNNSSGSSTSTFVQAIGISNAIAIACGSSHTVALRSDGLVFACGWDAYGQLGNNFTTANSTFAQMLGISIAVAVAAGTYHTVALRSDGLVFSCGNNNHGQLGVNSTTSQLTFVQTTGISNAIAVLAGQSHTVALRSDGLVFACGYNKYGQLDINSTINQSTFVQAL